MKTGASARGFTHSSDAERGTIGFPCFRCGVCCSGYQVHLSLEEACSIADNLGISSEEFVTQYTDPCWPGEASRLVRQHAGVCVFLDQPAGSIIGLCRIHAFKPTACREWMANLYRKECRQGLSRYWGLVVDESLTLVGSPEALQAFQAFIDSLE